MGKQATFANDFLKLILQAVAIANLADNAASSPDTNLYVSLHTADPTSGNQSTSEATYTNYARVPIVRTSSGWAVSSAVGSNVGATTFPQCGVTGNTITFFGVGRLATTAGKLLWSGATNSLAVSNGITPSFAAGAATLTES